MAAPSPLGPLAGSYEERTCLRCWEGKQYDATAGEWVACEMCGGKGAARVFVYPARRRKTGAR